MAGRVEPAVFDSIRSSATGGRLSIATQPLSPKQGSQMSGCLHDDLRQSRISQHLSRVIAQAQGQSPTSKPMKVPVGIKNSTFRLSENYSEVMDIVDLVNRSTFHKPFEPIIRKLDRQIGRRARFVFQDGVLVEQDSSRPTPEITDTDWWPRSPHSRPISPDVSEIRPLGNKSSKQSRISSIADKLAELTSALQEKRRTAVVSKFTALESLIEKINNSKLQDSFRKLVKELSHQKTELLLRKAVKPNYATVRRFMQANLPDAIEKTEILALRLAKQSAFSIIRAEACFNKMEEVRHKLNVKAGFELLRVNWEEQKKARQSEKVLSFMMKLDTYLLLLKFNAFYNLRVD